MLNSNSPIPLYRQLADILTEQIRSGDYPVGSRIPSEIHLAKKFGIGRPTARQATDTLVRKGMLVRRRGAGTFVQATQREVDLFSLAGTMTAFNEKGLPITTRILKRMCLSTIDDDSANPFFGHKAYWFSRLSLVDHEPVLIEDFYLHDTLFFGIDRIDVTDQSLSQIVQDKYFMTPKGGKQNFRIGYLSGKRARLLAISSDSPVLIVHRFLHFQQADNAVYSELFCRTDRFVFSQTLGDITDGSSRVL